MRALCELQQAAQAGQTIVATQPVTAVTPVIAATTVPKTVAAGGATPLITSVTPATVTQAARIQVRVVLPVVFNAPPTQGA